VQRWHSRAQRVFNHFVHRAIFRVIIIACHRQLTANIAFTIFDAASFAKLQHEAATTTCERRAATDSAALSEEHRIAVMSYNRYHAGCRGH
jgi:hypothetical protein